MPRTHRALSLIALAGFGLGCGDSNTAPKVKTERKIDLVPPLSPAEVEAKKKEMMKGTGGGAKTSAPSGS